MAVLHCWDAHDFSPETNDGMEKTIYYECTVHTPTQLIKDERLSLVIFLRTNYKISSLHHTELVCVNSVVFISAISFFTNENDGKIVARCLRFSRNANVRLIHLWFIRCSLYAFACE